MKHLVTLDDWSSAEIEEILELAAALKRDPDSYSNALRRKVLLMIFEKPSLRTRLSFETGMVQLGGHAIHFDMSTLPLGSGKESVHDTVKVAGRYVDLIMARLYEHSMLEEMASNSDIPVINALTNRAHPCQVLADLLTIQEVRGKLGGVVLAYIGDSENNMTYSLMAGAAKMGINMRIGCPDNPRFLPRQDVLEYYRGVAGEQGGRIEVHHDPEDAVRDADVVYTDSWMSYHVAQEELAQRVIGLMPYQVTNHLMECARPDAIFMNCLPALRGYEQTAEVIDGPRSVVFDQAENRLHSQKAVMIRLLG